MRKPMFGGIPTIWVKKGVKLFLITAVLAMIVGIILPQLHYSANNLKQRATRARHLLVDTLNAHFPVFRDSRQKEQLFQTQLNNYFPFLETDSLRKEYAVNHKQLTIYIEESRIRAEYKLKLPANSKLFWSIQEFVSQGLGNFQPEANELLIRSFLGRITIYGAVLDSLTFKLPGFDFVDSLQERSIVFESLSKPLQFGKNEVGNPLAFIALDPSRQQLQYDQSEIEVISSAHQLHLTNFRDSISIYRDSLLLLQNLEEFFFFGIIPDEAVDSAGSPTAVVKKAGGFELTKMQIVGPLITGFLFSLPFLLFLWLGKHQSLSEQVEFRLFFSSALMITFLYLGLGGFRALADFNWQLRTLFSDFFPPLARLSGEALSAGLRIMLVFAVVVWPALVRRQSQKMMAGGVPSTASPQLLLGESTRSKKWLQWIALGWGILDVLLFSAMSIPGTFTDSGEVAWLNIVHFIAIYLLFWLLFVELFGHRNAWWKSVGFIIWLFALDYVTQLLFDVPLRTPWVLLLSFWFLWPIAKTFFQMVSATPFESYWPTWSRRQKWGFRLALIAFILLLIWPNESNKNTTVSWMVIMPIWQMATLLGFFLLFSFFRLFRHLPIRDNSGRLPTATRDTGIVLALIYFFLPNSQGLVYIVIVFVIGYLLLRNWIFVERSQLTPATTPNHTVHLRSAINHLIAFKHAKRSLAQLKRELSGKVAKGEMKYEEYEQDIAAMEQLVGTKEIELKQYDMDGNPLNNELSVSPWERGKNGALYGFLFALPWILLFIRNLLVAPPTEGGGSNAWLSLVAYGAGALLQWPLHGFFIGYFYPHLRGDNGLERGFYVFTLIFLPTVVASAITNSFIAGTLGFSLWFWALQLFIQCILLGLWVGDYMALKLAGFPFRKLLDVYNVGTLATWGSSLIIAIGAGVTSLVSGGAVNLINQSIRLLLPVIPGFEEVDPGGPVEGVQVPQEK